MKAKRKVSKLKFLATVKTGPEIDPAVFKIAEGLCQSLELNAQTLGPDHFEIIQAFVWFFLQQAFDEGKAAAQVDLIAQAQETIKALRSAATAASPRGGKEGL
jgi:hypothetical protein